MIALESASVISHTEKATFEQMHLKVPRQEQIDYELEGLTEHLKDSYELMFEKGITPYYMRLCHEAYEKGIISVDKMAEMLDVSLYELPYVLDNFRLKLNNGDSI